MRRRFFVMSLVCMLMVMMFGMTAMASSNTWYFDFGAQNFEMKQGEDLPLWMHAEGNYRWFIKEQTSDGTWLECTCQGGTDEVIVHIGADEQAEVVYFVFYPVDNDTDWDGFQVTVRKSAEGLAAAPASVAVPLAGAGGTLTSEMDSKVALLRDAYGTPLAAFAIASHVQEKFTLLPPVVLGDRIWLNVKTLHDSAKNIQISPVDRARMTAAGVDGVFINGVPVNWP